MSRWIRLVNEAVLPLALLAGLLALVLPSKTVAANSDLILAVLVLATALGMDPTRFLQLRNHWRLVLALSVIPFATLAPAAWILSRLFASPIREGILTLGLAPTEVAAGGLVILAGGDAALALAAVVGSLIVSALAGPLLLATLLGGSGAISGGELILRFALVVIVPLLVGIGARWMIPRLAQLETEFSAAGTLTVALLVYASLSGAGSQAVLGPTLAGSIAFLFASMLLGMIMALSVGRANRMTVPLVVGMRDFAVAAVLATEAFGPPAAGVAGVYGVLVIIGGAATASFLRRHKHRRSSEH